MPPVAPLDGSEATQTDAYNCIWNERNGFFEGPSSNCSDPPLPVWSRQFGQRTWGREPRTDVVRQVCVRFRSFCHAAGHH